MRFNLRCVRIECQTEPLLDKRTRDLWPVELRVGEVVCVVIAYCPIELAIDLCLFDV